MTGRGPSARIAGVLLIAAVLCSGVVGRGLAIASPGIDPLTSAVGAPSQPARIAAPLERWRPLDQDGGDCDVRGTVETPAEGTTLTAGPLTIVGWAVDVNAPNGTGVTEVRIALDADPDQGGVPVPAVYGLDRPDIAELLGDPRWRLSGFSLAWDATTAASGAHILYIQVQSACGWTGATRSVNLQGGAAAATATQAVTPTLAVTPTIFPSPVLTTPTLGSVTPTLAVGTPTVGTPSTVVAAAAAISGTPTAVGTLAFPTVLLTTATPAPSPTGAIAAPTGLTVSVNPIDGAIFLSWIAPAAQVVAYEIVANQPNGDVQVLREVPGSVTRAVLPGLDPRIGYSISVIGVDAFGRRGALSTAVNTAGAPTATPLPTPTLSPYCTPVPYGPPICPGPGGLGGYGTCPPGMVPAGGLAPGAFPGLFPGGVPQYPGGVPPFPYQVPGQYPGAIPGQYPGAIPGQYPGGIPGQYPGQQCIPATGQPGYPGYPGYPGGAYGGAMNLTAIQSGPNSVQLSWTPLPGATQYRIWQGPSGSPPVDSGQVVSTTTWTANIPQTGIPYTFQVHALGPAGNEIGVSNITSSTGSGYYPGGIGTGQVSPASRFVQPNPSLAAGGGSILLLATVLSTANTPLPGIPVTAYASGGAVVTPVNPSTDGSGNAQFRVTGPVNTSVTISGTAGGIPLQPITILITP